MIAPKLPASGCWPHPRSPRGANPHCARSFIASTPACWEVGAELEKEWAEVRVNAIEVKVIDQGHRADKPGVFLPGLGVGAFLGTEDRCLLLGLTDKEDALG